MTLPPLNPDGTLPAKKEAICADCLEPMSSKSCATQQSQTEEKTPETMEKPPKGHFHGRGVYHNGICEACYRAGQRSVKSASLNQTK